MFYTAILYLCLLVYQLTRIILRLSFEPTIFGLSPGFVPITFFRWSLRLLALSWGVLQTGTSIFSGRLGLIYPELFLLLFSSELPIVPSARAIPSLATCVLSASVRPFDLRSSKSANTISPNLGNPSLVWIVLLLSSLPLTVR
jgi:hypothetical protein